MTCGIAHDFRNILAVIDSGSRLAESNLSDPEKSAPSFPALAKEPRGVRLTSQLLNYAQRSEFETCVADANSLLSNLLNRFWNTVLDRLSVSFFRIRRRFQNVL
jgi:hypothetical protein